MSTATKRQRENHRSNAAGDLCCGQRFNCHLTTFCVRKPGRTSAARFKVHLAPRTTGWLKEVKALDLQYRFDRRRRSDLAFQSQLLDFEDAVDLQDQRSKFLGVLLIGSSLTEFHSLLLVFLHDPSQILLKRECLWSASSTVWMKLHAVRLSLGNDSGIVFTYWRIGSNDGWSQPVIYSVRPWHEVKLLKQAISARLERLPSVWQSN